MKLPEPYRDGRFGLSFEVFPPKGDAGERTMYAAVEELAAFDPAFVSVTYGAGGATQAKSLEIAAAVRDRFGLPVTGHFTCVGSTIDDIRGWMRRATEVGVENVMALRGDPPAGQETFTRTEGGLGYASELVELLSREFGHFGIGVAGYPETHQEAADADADMDNLKRKLDAGGDVVYTQLFYDNDDFLRWRDRCHAAGIDAPIVPGILPALSLKQVQKITGLCGSRLPEAFLADLQENEDDAEAQRQVGVAQSARQTAGLLAEGVPGLHFYVLNKSASTREVLLAAGVAEKLPESVPTVG